MFNPNLEDELGAVREIVAVAVEKARTPGTYNQSGNAAGRVSTVSREMAFPATAPTLTGARLIEFKRGGAGEDVDGNPIWALTLNADALDKSPLA
ncbi:hypothetical protein EON83_21405 [bacterium]|nr:MAG: hypothetical protein EON83_21405 [bacterium]